MKNKTGKLCWKFQRLLLVLMMLPWFAGNLAAQPGNRVVGTVKDVSGESLIGVNVLEKGTTNGAITDLNGHFQLTTGKDATLIFSFVGYKELQIKVTGSTLNVVMHEDTEMLDEVVVVGYGTQKRANLTGAVATMNNKDIAATPVSSISNALAGMLPGLVATSSSGKPGADASISIRGKSTWGNNSVLTVVDGVVREFNSLDPNEVESITILKDASAGAIYGARAANGVILITTKRGTSGKPQFSYNGRVGMQQPTRFPELMNAYEYAQSNNAGRINMGQKPDDPAFGSMFFTDEQMAAFKSGAVGTDWYAETMKNSSLQQAHNISVTGGTDAVKYFFSLGYTNQEGMFDGISFDRYNFRSNVDASITKYLTLSVNVDASLSQSNGKDWAENTIFSHVIMQRPILTAYNPVNGLPINTTGEHPIEEINSKGYSKYTKNNFYGTLSAKQELPFITKGLSVSGRVSYRKFYDFKKVFSVPYKMYDFDANNEIIGTKVVAPGGMKTELTENFTQTQEITYNLSLNYERQFKKHFVSALLLTEGYTSNGDKLEAYRTNFSSTVIDQLFAGGSSEINNTGSGSENARLGYVGRINYNYAERYLLEVSARYDGSENFPPGNRFGFFPAFSVGWRLSEEAFWKRMNLSMVDQLKFRASYGLVGNDRVSAFQYLDKYSYTTADNAKGAIFDGEHQQSIIYGKYPNYDITWEKAKILNLGLDVALWDGMLGIEFDYFNKRTTDILRSRVRSIPGTFGRTLPDENYAEVDTRGFELVLSHYHRIGKFNYGVRGNVAYSDNKARILDEAANAANYERYIGRPLDFRTGLVALGLFQSAEEIANAPIQYNDKSVSVGDIRYADLNGDGVVNDYDKTILSYNSGTPKLTFGLNLTANWAGFDFNALLQGAAKVDIMMTKDARNMFNNGGNSNSFAFMLDYWTPENIGAEFPRAYVGPNPNNNRDSSFWLKDTNYLRLKSMELGYTIPGLAKSGIQRLRVYVSGYNLLTFSDFKHFDPEITTGNGAYYPQQRTFNLGATITF